MGRCTNTEVYPRLVRSKSKSLTEGVPVLWAVDVGVSRTCRKEDPEGEREIEIERLRELIDGRREREERRRGECGEPGEPGWTWAAQVAIDEKVGERRAAKAGVAGVGGSGWVGRFFWGGRERNAYAGVRGAA